MSATKTLHQPPPTNGNFSKPIAVVPDEAKKSKQQNIALDRIGKGKNSRNDRDPQKFAELKASIANVGVLHMPHLLALDNGDYVPLFGFGRIEAMRELGFTHGDFIVHDEPLSDAEILRLQMEENETSEKPCDVDRGRAWKEYLELTGKTVKELAGERSVDPKTIRRCINIATKLPDEVHVLIRSGLGSSLAELTLKAEPTKRLDLCRRAVQENLTREQLALIVRQSKNPSASDGAGEKRFAISETTGKVQLRLYATEDTSLAEIQLSLETLLKSVKTVAKSRRATPDTLRTYLTKKEEQARLQVEQAEMAEVLNRLVEEDA